MDQIENINSGRLRVNWAYLEEFVRSYDLPKTFISEAIGMSPQYLQQCKKHGGICMKRIDDIVRRFPDFDKEKFLDYDYEEEARRRKEMIDNEHIFARVVRVPMLFDWAEVYPTNVKEGTVVKHKKYGQGVILKLDREMQRAHVYFNDREETILFAYPEAFIKDLEIVQ